MTPTTRIFALSVTVLFAVTGCNSDPVAGPEPSASASTAAVNDASQPRTRLAARAAAAKDLRQVVFYTFKQKDRPDRTVSVTRATDGSWRMDIPASAYSGVVDIALVYAGKALHQCALASTAHPYFGCVKLDGGLPPTSDPKLEHLLGDTLNVLTDRQLALAVTVADPLPGANTAECYSVESSAVSLKVPVDAGIYCYERDGTLTAARLAYGSLALTGKPGAAPPTVALPGPLVTGAPLPLVAPPPSPSATPKA